MSQPLSVRDMVTFCIFRIRVEDFAANHKVDTVMERALRRQVLSSTWFKDRTGNKPRRLQEEHKKVIQIKSTFCTSSEGSCESDAKDVIPTFSSCLLEPPKLRKLEQ